MLEREIQLVLVERHAAHRRVDAEALLPDQIAGLAVERLDDAVAVVEEDDAVVRERRRLVGAALAHRRHPGELQLPDVVARDLVQRAEIARGLIPAQHRPVAGRRVAQHLVGDARVVADLAGDGEAEDRRRGLAASARAGGLAARGLRGRARATSRRRLAAAAGRGSRGQERANRHRRVRGERLRARRRAVELQDVGGDGEIGGFRQAAGLLRRHRLDRGQQITRRAAAPADPERGAGERRRSGQVRAVAARARGLVGGASGGGLIGRERRGGRRLPGGDERQARDQQRAQQQRESSHRSSHPHRFAPSGASPLSP